MVFLDIGGVMYSDRRYRESLRKALHELGGEFSDAEFDAEYAACRRDQAGSFRRRLTGRFLGDASRSQEVEALASKHWRYQPADLYPDVKPALEQLSKSYRLGVLANQPSAVRSALERDGIDRFFDVWGVSDDLGLSKPDPRLFEHALSAALYVDGQESLGLGAVIRDDEERSTVIRKEEAVPVLVRVPRREPLVTRLELGPRSAYRRCALQHAHRAGVAGRCGAAEAAPCPSDDSPLLVAK